MSKIETNTTSLRTIAEKVNDVNNEVITQADLIAQVAQAMQGKGVPGGSGASVDTCSIRSYINTYVTGTYFATVYRNGVFTYETGEWDSSKTNEDIITDVVCGSTFTVQASSTRASFAEDGAVLLAKNSASVVFAAPTTPGAVGRVAVTAELI